MRCPNPCFTAYRVSQKSGPDYRQISSYITGYFTKFLVGWGTCFRERFSVPVRDGVRWGGGLALGMESNEGGLRKIVRWGQKCPLQQNYSKFWCFKQKIELSDAALSLKEKKEVKYLKLQGQNSVGGGQTLVKKWGWRSVGGTGKMFSAYYKTFLNKVPSFTYLITSLFTYH